MRAVAEREIVPQGQADPHDLLQAEGGCLCEFDAGDRRLVDPGTPLQPHLADGGAPSPES
jgi:hypothetical protein